MNILFVCTANISRSFLAKALFENEIQGLTGHPVHAASAGLRAHAGALPDPKMAAFLAENGISWGPHGARRISREDVKKSDLILVMEQAQAAILKKSFPEAEGKVMRLGSFLSPGQAPDDIIDPFGKSLYHYRLARSQITLAVKNLARELASGRIGKPDAHHQDHSG